MKMYLREACTPYGAEFAFLEKQMSTESRLQLGSHMIDTKGYMKKVLILRSSKEREWLIIRYIIATVSKL